SLHARPAKQAGERGQPCEQSALLRVAHELHGDGKRSVDEPEPAVHRIPPVRLDRRRRRDDRDARRGIGVDHSRLCGDRPEAVEGPAPDADPARAVAALPFPESSAHDDDYARRPVPDKDAASAWAMCSPTAWTYGSPSIVWWPPGTSRTSHCSSSTRSHPS